MAPEDTSRRDFIGDALRLAAGLPPAGLAAASNAVAQGSAVAGSAASPGAGITAATIAEAEKLHALHFTEEQRAELAATMPTQVKGAEALRRRRPIRSICSRRCTSIRGCPVSTIRSRKIGCVWRPARCRRCPKRC